MHWTIVAQIKMPANRIFPEDLTRITVTQVSNLVTIYSFCTATQEKQWLTNLVLAHGIIQVSTLQPLTPIKAW